MSFMTVKSTEAGMHGVATGEGPATCDMHIRAQVAVNGAPSPEPGTGPTDYVTSLAASSNANSARSSQPSESSLLEPWARQHNAEI
jgi:hypothetical protein